MSILVIDIGGNNVKLLASGQTEPRKFPSGTELSAAEMVEGVLRTAQGWEYEAVTLGYPGPVKAGRILEDPHNLGQGWLDFDFQAAFGRPVKILNDACMQALGSYQGGIMLFLGLGTGLGSALVAEGIPVPMELAHLGYKKATFEDYVGRRGLDEHGKKKWREHVEEVVEALRSALLPDDIVLGGGNVKKLKVMPAGCRRGANSHAFLGGFRMWDPNAQEPDLPEGPDEPDTLVIER